MLQTGALPSELEQREEENLPPLSTIVNINFNPIIEGACQILPDDCIVYLVNIRSIRSERAGLARAVAGPDSRALSSEVDMIRKYLFPFWGAEEEGEGEEEETPEIVETPSTKELTAEEIEKMTARAADRSARKARKGLAEELGFEDLNTFKDWVQAQQAAEKEAMNEKDRAIQEAKEAKAAAEALQNNLASERLDLAVQRHVVGAGISESKKIQRVAALVRLDLDADIINDEDAWDEAITEALTSVKEDAPELFAEAGSKGFGSGDGGARGRSDKEEDKEAENRKKLEKEFAERGLIAYDG